MTKLQSRPLPPFSTLEFEGVAIRHALWSDALEHDLLPEERQQISSAWSKKRRANFILGRAAAHDALEALGAPKRPVTRKIDDGPDWPKGFVGSISHCDEVGIAVAAVQSAVAGIGVDFERISDRPWKVLSRIADKQEQEIIRRSNERELNALLLFSVKEAAYKTLAPICRRYIAFSEVSLRMSGNPREPVELLPADSLSADLDGCSLRAKVAYSKEHICSLVWLMHSS